MAIIKHIEELPVRGRLLGVDHGRRRIGLAITDAERKLAQPLETLNAQRAQSAFQRLKTLVQSHHIKALIIGYPLEMDGREGPRCQSVRAFVRNIESMVDVPILYWDERLSSAAAKDYLQEAGLSNEQRISRIDQAAAAVILESLLCKLNG
jgi:putative Holliday junction resolvase